MSIWVAAFLDNGESGVVQTPCDASMEISRRGLPKANHFLLGVPSKACFGENRLGSSSQRGCVIDIHSYPKCCAVGVSHWRVDTYSINMEARSKQ